MEILIDNRDGTIWNVTEICSDLAWKTSRIGRAGSVDITLVKDAALQAKDFRYSNGDIVRIRSGQHNIFYGFIFSIDSNHDKTVKLIAYDQLRYLSSSESGIWQGKTATEIIRQLAEQFQLRVGNLVDTVFRFDLVETDKKAMDLITTALDKTLTAGYGLFVLYDDFGNLTLQNTQNLMVNLSVGESSLLTGYNYKQSIDEDTYNQIKIVQDNEKTGVREVHIVKDSANIARWGLLQQYKVADKNTNAEQIKEALNNLIALKNQETRKLRLDALGDLRIRAGVYFNVRIDEFGIDQNVLVDDCTHRWDGHSHTMQLEVRYEPVGDNQAS